MHSSKHFLCTGHLNTNKSRKYKIGRFWISEVQNRSESNSDDQLPEKQTPPWGSEQDPPCRLFGDFRIHKLEKIYGGGEGNRSTLQDSVKCVLHIISEVKLDTFVNSVLFCFAQGLVSRNTFQ